MKNIYSVSKINRYIKAMFENDVILRDIYIEGEISNYKEHSSGHIYFTLKDSGGAISCVMFRMNAAGLRFEPENGMKVTAGGYISVYEKTGNYQLYIDEMEKAGRGDLYAEFERLKKRLEKSGVFDERHKKKIPEYPKCIAVITSPTGAAVRDIIRVTGRRNSNVKIAVIPTLVQGENAGDDIVKSIRTVNEWKGADVIILGRGGGSIEDLWAFNEEKVARAIFESKIPIISAVGHETDFTIADFIADMRAATPSMAGEIAVKEIIGTEERIKNDFRRLNREMMRRIDEKRRRLDLCIKSRAMREPLERIYNYQIYINEIQRRMAREIDFKMEKSKTRLKNNIEALERISPVNILKKGYSLTYSGERLIKSIDEINENDEIRVYIDDGIIYGKVTGCSKNG